MDSTDIAITDIKDIHTPPIWWWGILRWVVLALAIAGLGVGAYYLIRWIRANYTDDKIHIKVQKKQVPTRPAEEIALEKLDAIREAKIWQTGQVKEYHTQLTDVVREYIALRFNINSTEQTSDETLQAIRGLLTDKRELFEDLRKMLTLADLVKFAKWTSTADENELSLRSAYVFVKETTPPAEEVTPNTQS
jgi:hypothetical protein